MAMFRQTALTAFLLLAACRPPASDDYVERGQISSGRQAPSEPIASPDTEGAVWAEALRENRLLYGKPGETPLMALECVESEGDPRLAFTRFARADPHAEAILALIGNSHVVRLFVDAQKQGDAWLWHGSVPADDPQLDVLTGARQVEATVPGAGSMILNPSRLPGELIETCQALASSAPSEPEDPA